MPATCTYNFDLLPTHAVASSGDPFFRIHYVEDNGTLIAKTVNDAPGDPTYLTKIDSAIPCSGCDFDQNIQVSTQNGGKVWFQNVSGKQMYTYMGCKHSNNPWAFSWKWINPNFEPAPGKSCTIMNRRWDDLDQALVFNPSEQCRASLEDDDCYYVLIFPDAYTPDGAVPLAITLEDEDGLLGTVRRIVNKPTRDTLAVSTLRAGCSACSAWNDLQLTMSVDGGRFEFKRFKMDIHCYKNTVHQGSYSVHVPQAYTWTSPSSVWDCTAVDNPGTVEMFSEDMCTVDL